MKINSEGDVCARCGEGKGEVPCSDDDGTYYICEKCDSDMYNTDTTFIVQEIDKQIRHHKGEGNNTAVRSLEYIREVVNNA